MRAIRYADPRPLPLPVCWSLWIALSGGFWFAVALVMLA